MIYEGKRYGIVKSEIENLETILNSFLEYAENLLRIRINSRSVNGMSGRISISLPILGGWTGNVSMTQMTERAHEAHIIGNSMKTEVHDLLGLIKSKTESQLAADEAVAAKQLAEVNAARDEILDSIEASQDKIRTAVTSIADEVNTLPSFSPEAVRFPSWPVC